MTSAQPIFTPEPTPGFWVHDLSPFIVKFPDGFFLDGIRWYGMAYLAGFIFGAIMLHVYFKRGRSPLDPPAQQNFIIALVVGIIVGARLGYMFFYASDAFFSAPLSVFKVWHGGMSSHGGMLGAVVATLWSSRKCKCGFLKLCDIIATLAGAGIFFGRCANFVNGELWGKETDVPWAVIFKWHFYDFAGAEHIGYLLPRHPSQLYEAALEGLLILAWTQFRFWKKVPLPAGQLFGEASILYGIVRVINEQFREPDIGVSFILGMSRGQFYSLILIVVGIAFVVASRYRKDKNPTTNPEV
ncbi:MAG: prolipoprotein diacylglyceryl transferase [Opitutae bacterium]|nr:prolipoprotein diacylglyceryl transferase [Opitutae bacterium]